MMVSSAGDYIPRLPAELETVAETATFGLEVEANLVGQNGQLLAELHRQVNHPALVLNFDAANGVTYDCK